MTDMTHTPGRPFLGIAAALVAALVAATVALPGRAQTGNVRVEAMNTPDLTFEVLDLRRVEGGMLRLSARVVNKSSEMVTITLPDVKIVDAPNRLQYPPVRVGGYTLSSSGNHVRIAGQSQQAFWMNFPAPADRVEKVSVHVPEYMPADNVPIVR